MSRYFQSSYNGSNDYKKYREERLGKNIDHSIPSDTKFFTQDTSSRLTSRRTTEKQHLQTFGKQTSRQENQNQNKYDDLYSKYKQPEISKIQDTLKYDSCSFLSKKGYTSNLEPTKSQEDRISAFMKDRYGAKDRMAFLNEQNLGKNAFPTQETKVGSNLRGISTNREKYSRNYETGKCEQGSESFQDSIITRRKNYEQLNSVTNLDSSVSSKTYNYSSKIRNRADEGFDSKLFQPKERVLSRDIVFEDKYKPKSDILMDVPSTSPYKSRNQMIKERLNLAKKDDQYETSSRNFKRQFVTQQELTKDYETKREFVPSQIKTAQVTPQKVPLSVRDGRNASQQRRKSLIEKSQMLKEKLNRLNASSNTKVIENEENHPVQKGNQKQNSTQNYTPKRYITNSFRVNFDDSQQNDKSVSKKLNFQDIANKAEPLKTRNYSTNSAIKSATMSDLKEPMISQTAGQGALKKISELNQRINSRLEFILKNYG